MQPGSGAGGAQALMMIDVHFFGENHIIPLHSPTSFICSVVDQSKVLCVHFRRSWLSCPWCQVGHWQLVCYKQKRTFNADHKVDSSNALCCWNFCWKVPRFVEIFVLFVRTWRLEGVDHKMLGFWLRDCVILCDELRKRFQLFRRGLRQLESPLPVLLVMPGRHKPALILATNASFSSEGFTGDSSMHRG